MISGLLGVAVRVDLINSRGQTTIMELKLYTDLIDALGKVAGGLKAIVNLPTEKGPHTFFTNEASRNRLQTLNT